MPSERADQPAPRFGAGIPARARAYVAVVIAAGALVGVLSAAWGVALRVRVGWPEAGAGLLVALLTFVLQRRGFVFHWRGQRTTSTLDEPAVFLGLLLLAPPLALGAVVAGIAAAQVVARRAPVKAAYNVAAYAVAAALACLAFAGARALGAPPLVAGIPAVVAYALATNLSISGLFARLEGEPMPRIFVERFGRATLLNALFGASLVLCVASLWRLHPVAVLALAPFAFLSMSFINLNARAEREVRVRRQLEGLTVSLVRSARLDAVAEGILDKCGEMFLAGRAVLTVDQATSDGRPRTWARDFESGPAASRDPLEAPVLGRNGRRLGAIRIHPPQRSPMANSVELDAPLLATVAGQAGAAIELTGAFHELMGLKDLHQGIVENVPAGILRMDATGRIVQANRYFERHLGAPGEVWPALQAVDDLAERVRGMLAGRAFLDVEVALDGRSFSVSGVPLPQADAEEGQRPGGILLFHDVTPRKQAEDALKSQTLTRPFVRRLVLDLVGNLGASERAIAELGRRVSREVRASDAHEFVAAFRSLGLGELRVTSVEGEAYTFEGDDLLEKRARSTQPTCHLARGYLEGAVSSLHGSAALGTELRCQSQGHERCVFMVKPRPLETPPARAGRPSIVAVTPPLVPQPPRGPR